MARDELAAMTHDKWDETVWGSAENSLSPTRPPRLFFYWGSSDHWIANTTRDKVIAARAYSGAKEEEWKPRMEIDTSGVPHDFVMRKCSLCIDFAPLVQCSTKGTDVNEPLGHSEIIAHKAFDFVEDIVSSDTRSN